MYSTIIVPLDGSPFAELALPIAARLARRHGAALHLVAAHSSFVRPLEITGAPVYDSAFDDERRRELGDYLAGVADRLRAEQGTQAKITHRLLNAGGAAQAISEEAGQRDADLIVMTTHGRGGFARVWLGSVATELVRSSPTPILLVRVPEDGPRTPAVDVAGLSHVLVPVDGSPLAEAAVDHALALVQPAGARCTLLRVVRTADTLLPYDQTFWTPSEQEIMDEQREIAERYVRELADRVRARSAGGGEGGTVDAVVVLEPDPARAILRAAADGGVDLLALSTHARSGVTRAFLGSVTDKVVRGAEVPVLVVRPRED